MALMTNYWMLDSLIALSAFIVLAYLYMTRKFNYWKKRGVFEIPPVPFIGNFGDCLFFKKTPGYFLKDLYDKAKGRPYMGFYVLDRPFFLACDREMIKNILVKDFNYFNDRHSAANKEDRLGYANLFIIKNPTWKILRTKLTPIFTSGKLKKMFELLLECIENLKTHLKSLETEGKETMVDMKELAAKITTDMIGTTAYGLNVNSLNNPNAEFRKYGRKIFEYDYIRSIELFSVFFLPDVTRLAGCTFFGKTSSKFLRSAFWDTINRRVESGQKRNDLIDILIEFRKTYGDQDLGGFRFDGDDLVAQAAIFFTGGFETSSTAIAFAFYEIAMNQNIQNRLRKEIVDALSETDGKFTYDMITSLPYLDMVVAESLRLYPVLPFLDRVTIQDYKVPNSDLVLEKGTPVYISMMGLHLDPQYYPDPQKFDPERFTEENKAKRPACVYLPFGDGPRACIGTRLGLIQTKLAIAQVISQYELTPCKETPIPMVLDPKALTISPSKGTLYLNIRNINSNNNCKF